jgi:hypothetical protein
MQLIPVQRPEGGVQEGPAGGVHTQELCTRFLIAFVRSLLATLSSDHVILAVSAAAREVGIPRELAESALPALLGYQKRNSIWPEGFMG